MDLAELGDAFPAGLAVPHQPFGRIASRGAVALAALQQPENHFDLGRLELGAVGAFTRGIGAAGS